MNIVNYLVNTYGYDTPIFLKDVRIGGKSKAAIKESFYRAAKDGKLEKMKNGIYFIRSDKEFGSGIIFEDIIEQKFIYEKGFSKENNYQHVVGYYSGQTFLNIIHISNQVPMVPEITTNNTNSKKRFFECGKQMAIIRKSRTEINSENWKMLQFLDMFYYLVEYEIDENIKLLKNYIKRRNLTKSTFDQCIKYYDNRTIEKLKRGNIIKAFK